MRLKARSFVFLLVCCLVLFFLIAKRSKNGDVVDHHHATSRIVHHSLSDSNITYNPEVHANITPDHPHLISYYPDIDIRGKWQQKQISKFCAHYHLSNTTYTLDLKNPLKSEFYRHVLFDDHSRSLYCFIPKVGCTTARTTIFVGIGRLPTSVLDMVRGTPLLKMKPSLEIKLEQATKKASFLNHSLTDDLRIDRLRSYGKYTVIRHPLQRLLSAYLDKISYPLIPKNQKTVKPLNYFQKLSHEMIEYTRPIQYAQWMNDSRHTQIKAQFSDFLLWIIEQDLALVNEHFAPQVYNSQPCRVRYHFYGNFDHFHQDFAMVLSKFQFDGSNILKLLPPRRGMSAADQVNSYWSNISLTLKHKVYDKFKMEFDFYHSLYPEEIKITDKILELTVLD